ncbi:MAG: hypothetical protein ACM3VS_02140 [Candidatus Dadabacteria bacterium]
MKETKKNNETNLNRRTDDGNLGRIKEKKEDHKQDISHVDQQEGHMDHGTTGTGTDIDKNKENDR